MGKGLNWRFVDLTGQKFGRLTALRRGPNQGVHTCWYCECECGAERLVRHQNLVTGNTLSCGCFGREQKSQMTRQRNAGGHRQSLRNARTKAYVVWSNMIQRCTNPKNSAFDDYGARGIAVCERWRTFENFYADIGDPPEGLTLDRIDNNGNYEPGNCRWADRPTQRKNQRKPRSEHLRDRKGRLITFNGETHSVVQWSKKLGFSRNTISERLRKGWTAEMALSTPLNTSQSRRRKP